MSSSSTTTVDSSETKEQHETKTKTKVSVVVPIRNEEAHIEDTLRMLLDQEQDGLDVEILVADGRSTDRTREIVEGLSQQHPQIKLFDNPDRLSSAARNVGVRNSTGDYIVVIDGHCEIRSRSYFVDLVSAFERTGADCLGRPQPLDISDATLFQKAVASARNSPFGHHPDSFIYSDQEQEVPALSVAVAYRKEVFDKVGLFDAKFDACEDCEMNHRIDQAGLKCFLIPQLTVHYKPRTSLSGLFKQLSRYGRGRVRLARKHSESLSLSSLIPALFIVGLVTGPLVSFFVPVLWFVYGGVLALYVLLALGYSLKASIDSGNVSTLFWLPPIFLTIHLASGWGILAEFLISNQPRNSSQKQLTDAKETGSQK